MGNKTISVGTQFLTGVGEHRFPLSPRVYLTGYFYQENERKRVAHTTPYIRFKGKVTSEKRRGNNFRGRI